VSTGLAFPKPPRRVRDPKVLAAYHRAHPRCELLTCRKPAMAQPHHIHPNGVQGPGDLEQNLLSLCVLHHVGPLGPHTLGHRTWLVRFGFNLEDDTRKKVRRALRGLPKGL
jgi:hypothetical protein